MDSVLKNNINVKTVLLGTSNVGKSSLMNRYIYNRFDERDSAPTIGVAFFHKIINKHSAKFDVAIWDSGGQERYRSLMPMYYRKSHLVFICIDLNSISIIKDIYNWLDEVTNNTLEKPLIYIIGTKLDTIDKSQETSIRNLVEKEFPEFPFYTTSSKYNIGIDKVFDNAMDNAIDNRYFSIINSPPSEPIRGSIDIDTIDLSSGNNSYYSSCIGSHSCILM